MTLLRPAMRQSRAAKAPDSPPMCEETDASQSTLSLSNRNGSTRKSVATLIGADWLQRTKCNGRHRLDLLERLIVRDSAMVMLCALGGGASACLQHELILKVG